MRRIVTIILVAGLLLNMTVPVLAEPPGAETEAPVFGFSEDDSEKDADPSETDSDSDVKESEAKSEESADPEAESDTKEDQKNGRADGQIVSDPDKKDVQDDERNKQATNIRQLVFLTSRLILKFHRSSDSCGLKCVF
jgi:hypothetical protein